MAQALEGGVVKKQSVFQILTRSTIWLGLDQELRTYIKPRDQDDDILFDDNIIPCGKLFRSQQFRNKADIVDLHQHGHGVVLLFLLTKSYDNIQ